MKKKYLLTIGLIAILLTSCGNKTQKDNSTNEDLLKRIGELEEENKNLKAQLKASDVNNSESNESTPANEDTVGTNNNFLGINDEWVVDGQWKLKILDVKTTQDRNPYNEKNPNQVVIVSYTYENIGYEDDFMDGLYLTPEQIIDANGSVGYKYPANTTYYADNIPVGSKVDIAEEAFGLNNQSNEVSINFVQYDGNGNKQKATFKVPVN